MKRKLISILLIVLLSAALFVPALAEDAPAVTRAGWISQLVQTFGLTVEDDNYPDNYYSDLTSDRSDYHDILTAVEFGLVDLDLGEAFRPDEAATREFAAQTLNYCLGYQLDADTEYTFSEAADLLNCPDDLQVAVNRGWFQLVDGEVLPDQPLTADEQTAMLADAKAALQGEVIDPEHENSYTFTADVVEIPDGTTVTVSDGEIRVLNCPVEVAQGNIIAVYQNGIPTAYTVNTVSKELTTLVLGVTQLENTEDIYTGIDAQGTVEASLEDVVALDPDAELSYYLPDTGVEYATYEEALDAAAQLAGTNASGSLKPKIELVVNHTFTIGSGASVSLNAKFKNAVVDYKISLAKMQAYVKLSFDADVSYQVKVDSAKVHEVDDIKLLFWGIPGVGGVTISMEGELAAAVTGIQKWHATCGIEVSKADGVRMPHQFDSKTFAVSVEGSAKLGLKAKFGVTELPAINAYLYGSLGAAGSLKSTTYDDTEQPFHCTHFAAYLYAKCGATGSVKLLSYKKTISFDYNIYTETNSPLRIVHHYEDGKLTESCTRDGSGVPTDSMGSKNNYTTPTTSIYSGSGWSGGSNSGSGTGSGSTTTATYTYTTDSSGNATITGFSGNATSLIIPSTLDGYPVTAIGNEAFAKKTGLQSVIVPDSVTTIGSYAFDGCTKLSSITLSNSLKTIGSRCFYNCTSLTYVFVPKTVTSVAKYISSYYGPFQGCSALETIELEEGMTAIPAYLCNGCAIETITIPNTVTSIGNYAFSESTKLKKITIPNSVTSIGEYAFSGCAGLKEIEMADSVQSLGAYAFASCTGLEEIVLPDSVTSIGSYAFDYCIKLSSITLPGNLKTIGSRCFYNCTSLTYVFVPKTVTGVAKYISSYYGPFQGCSALETIELEEGMTAIPAYLCNGCAIETITIPNTVTSIGNYAFSESTKLKKITIPNSVTSIGDYAFRSCTGLKEIEMADSVLSLGNYAFASCTGLEEIVLPDSVTSIGSYAFDYCIKLSSMTLPGNLKTIGSRCFYNCTSLTYVFVPKTVTGVAKYISSYYGPFQGCSALETIELEEGMTAIPAYLCMGCTATETITIPDTVESIGNHAFEGSTGLKEIVIPGSVTSIGAEAFKNCTSLEEIVVPNSVTSIGNYAFQNCSGLERLTLSSGLTNMGKYIFQGCSSLQALTVPENVTYVDEYAFDGCTSLSEIIWNEKLTKINAYAFRGCGITELDIPATVTTVGNYAFSNCDALTRASVPDSVTSLGTYAFYDCDALTDVTLGTGITELPTSAFEHCDSLTKITIPRRVTKIGDNAFKNCVKFVEIHIPRSVTTISSTAFSYLSKLTIYGVSGTYAETYANANNITFISEDVTAESVTIDPASLTLLKGKTAQLTLTIAPVGCTDAVSWKSANTAVATVDDTGLVKAVGIGSTIIKVVVGGKSASCKVTVGQPVTGISLNKTALTLNALDTYQLTATVTPADAADPSVVWTSSNDAVATVSDTGLVTALGKGSATITVKANDGSGVSKTCTVTVSNTAHVAATVDELESPHNYPDSCSDFWVYTRPGAESLTVTFDERTNIEDGFDSLYIYDGSGNQIGKYTGTELAGQTVEIPGDTIRIQLVSDTSGNEWGFKVTNVTAAGETIPGDLNGDGSLTSADLVLLSKALTGSITLTAAQKTAADLNGDGNITSADAVLLAKKLIAQ